MTNYGFIFADAAFRKSVEDAVNKVSSSSSSSTAGSTGIFSSINSDVIFKFLFIIAIIAIIKYALEAYFTHKKTKAEVEAAKIEATAKLLAEVNRSRDAYASPLLRAAFGKLSPEEALKKLQDVDAASKNLASQNLRGFAGSDDDLTQIVDDLLSSLNEEEK